MSFEMSAWLSAIFSGFKNLLRPRLLEKSESNDEGLKIIGTAQKRD